MTINPWRGDAMKTRDARQPDDRQEIPITVADVRVLDDGWMCAAIRLVADEHFETGYYMIFREQGDVVRIVGPSCIQWRGVTLKLGDPSPSARMILSRPERDVTFPPQVETLIATLKRKASSVPESEESAVRCRDDDH
jgi:hypothetical protein